MTVNMAISNSEILDAFFESRMKLSQTIKTVIDFVRDEAIN